jgi:hypothetical protein
VKAERYSVFPRKVARKLGEEGADDDDDDDEWRVRIGRRRNCKT